MSNIWIDITTSMEWSGGVVGIVRSELEIVASLSRHNSDIRFSIFKNGGFIEVHKENLSWAQNDVDVIDTYLESRKHVQEISSASISNLESKINSHIKQILVDVPSRFCRIERALLLFVSALPYCSQYLGLLLTWIPRKALRLSVKLMAILRIWKALPAESIVSDSLNQHQLIYPYKKGDLVVSLGWLDNGKEPIFSKIKEIDPRIILVYMVYDIILIGGSTKHLYRSQEEDSFNSYFHWISQTCDFILYAGKSPQRDGEYYQKYVGWRTPQSIAIPFGGSDLTKKVEIDGGKRIV